MTETERQQFARANAVRTVIFNTLKLRGFNKFHCPRDVRDEMDLTDDLGADSIDVLELFCDVEDKLGVEFERTGEIRTVGDLIAAVEEVSASV